MTTRSVLLATLASLSIVGVAQEMDNKAAAWIGKTAKAVPVVDMAGNKVDLAKEFGKRPVVLVFYRGVWCPFCHKQLRELQAIEADLKAANAIVYVVSNEASDKLDAMRQAEKLGSTFVSLSDPEAKLAALYAGKYDQGYLKPATVVVGKKGKIVFASSLEDYKIRADSQAVLKAVRDTKLGKQTKM